jgi:hypothetical protein
MNAVDEPSTRDLATERDCLQRAELKAGRSGFAEHAVNRLAAGAATYGDRWATLGVARLLIELTEEAADLGAWGVLALQALERDDTLPRTSRARLGARLERAIACGARAHRELQRARLELERAARNSALRRQTFTPDVDGRCLNCGRAYTAHPGNQCSPCVEGARRAA